MKLVQKKELWKKFWESFIITLCLESILSVNTICSFSSVQQEGGNAFSLTRPYSMQCIQESEEIFI
jgi:hypothetical protein